MPLKAVVEPGPPISEDDVQGLERRVGISLPREYRDFLSKNNGGCPLPAVYHIRWKTNPEGDVERFYGIATDESDDDLEKMIKEWADVMPKGHIPIGRACTGDQIVLCVKGLHRDSIYYWDLYDVDSKPERRVHLIARSFKKFLACLYDAADEEPTGPRYNPWRPKQPVFRRGGHVEVPDFTGPIEPTLSKCHHKMGPFLYTGPQLSNHDLDEVQEHMGVVLPNGYRELLREVNGGRPRDELFFPIRSDGPDDHVGEIGVLGDIYGIGTGSDYYDLVRWNRALAGYLPAGWLAIANDGNAENQIVLAVDGPRIGRVCLWDAYTRARRREEDLAPIADSLDKFFDLLTDDMSRLF